MTAFGGYRPLALDLCSDQGHSLYQTTAKGPGSNSLQERRVMKKILYEAVKPVCKYHDYAVNVVFPFLAIFRLKITK